MIVDVEQHHGGRNQFETGGVRAAPGRDGRSGLRAGPVRARGAGKGREEARPRRAMCYADERAVASARGKGATGRHAASEDGSWHHRRSHRGQIGAGDQTARPGSRDAMAPRPRWFQRVLTSSLSQRLDVALVMAQVRLAHPGDRVRYFRRQPLVSQRQRCPLGVTPIRVCGKQLFPHSEFVAKDLAAVSSRVFCVPAIDNGDAVPARRGRARVYRRGAPVAAAARPPGDVEVRRSAGLGRRSDRCRRRRRSAC